MKLLPNLVNRGRFRLPPQNVVIAYPAGEKIIWIAANRKRKKWEVSTPLISEIENFGEQVRKTVDKHSNIFLIVAPRKSYGFTKAIYPAGVRGNLEKIIDYESSEITPLKNDAVMNIGSLVREGDMLLASVAWIQKNNLNRLRTIVNDKLKNTFTTPDTMLVQNFIHDHSSWNANGNSWLLHSVGDCLWVYHACKGEIIESLIITSNQSPIAQITNAKLHEADRVIFVGEDAEVLSRFNIDRHPDLVIDRKDFFTSAVRHVLDKEWISCFEGKLRLNYPEIPKSVFIPILLMITLLGYGIFLQSSVKAVETELANVLSRKAKLEKEWKPLEQQLKAVEKLESDKKTLQNLLGQGIPVLTFLEVLTEKTPADTWLNYLTVNQNNFVMLRGESRSAVQYVGILSKIPGFKKVSFASPVRKNPRTNKEYFNIKFTVDWGEFRKSLGKNFAANKD